MAEARQTYVDTNMGTDELVDLIAGRLAGDRNVLPIGACDCRDCAVQVARGCLHALGLLPPE